MLVWSVVRVLLKSAPKSFTSLYAFAYLVLPNGGGPRGRYCDGLVSVNGVTLANQGASAGAKGGGGLGRYEGVGRHSPIAVPPMKGGGFSGKLPSLARKAMIPAAAWCPT